MPRHLEDLKTPGVFQRITSGKKPTQKLPVNTTPLIIRSSSNTIRNKIIMSGFAEKSLTSHLEKTQKHLPEPFSKAFSEFPDQGSSHRRPGKNDQKHRTEGENTWVKKTIVACRDNKSFEPKSTFNLDLCSNSSLSSAGPWTSIHPLPTPPEATEVGASRSGRLGRWRRGGSRSLWRRGCERGRGTWSRGDGQRAEEAGWKLLVASKRRLIGMASTLIAMAST